MSDHPPNDCRAEFEAWAAQEGHDITLYVPGEYDYGHVNDLFVAWQAAWNTRAHRTPESSFPSVEHALRRLVALKEHKDQHGKDAYYEFEQPIAWRVAKDALRGPTSQERSTPDLDGLVGKLEALKVEADGAGQGVSSWRHERNYVIEECIALVHQHFGEKP